MTAIDQHAPVTFDDRGLGCVVARLGVLDVGGVMVPAEATGGLVWWRVTLPGVSTRFRRSASADAARNELAACVRQWIDAAGLAASPADEQPIRAFRLSDLHGVVR